MKFYILMIFTIFSLISCKPKYNNYSYIKVMGIGETDSVSADNKGMGLYSYLYYNPVNDSVLFRYTQSVQPDSFITYKGIFKNKHFSDTISMLINVLKKYKNGQIPDHGDSNSNYDGPEWFVEYTDKSGIHFNSFTLSDNDTLELFSDFFLRLKHLQWEKRIVDNNIIDMDKIVVKVLKGMNIYDSIIPPYKPLPCKKEINMKMLYGKWRTIGDKYNKGNYYFTINTVDENGSWQLIRSNRGKLTTIFSGKIIFIKNHSIQIKSKHGIATLKVINLSENCFEYQVGNSKSILRLDRVKE